MNYSPIDIILAAVILIYALIGLKRGLIMTIANVLGNLFAFLGAYYGAKALSVPFTNAVILPLFGGKLQEAATGLLGVDYSKALTFDQIWNSLSQSTQALMNQIGQQKDILLKSKNPVETLIDGISANIAQNISFLILFVILFCVLSVVVYLIFKAIDIVGNVVLLGPANAIAGGVVGALCGLLICCCTIWTLQAVAPTLFSDTGILSKQKLQTTIIAKKIVETRPDIFIFKIPEITKPTVKI